jgi:hypothetical protein
LDHTVEEVVEEAVAEVKLEEKEVVVEQTVDYPLLNTT